MCPQCHSSFISSHLCSFEGELAVFLLTQNSQKPSWSFLIGILHFLQWGSSFLHFPITYSLFPPETSPEYVHISSNILFTMICVFPKMIEASSTASFFLSEALLDLLLTLCFYKQSFRGNLGFSYSVSQNSSSHHYYPIQSYFHIVRYLLAHYLSLSKSILAF